MSVVTLERSAFRGYTEAAVWRNKLLDPTLKNRSIRVISRTITKTRTRQVNRVLIRLSRMLSWDIPVYASRQPARNGQPASGVQFCSRGVCAAVTDRLLLRRVAVQVRRAAETKRHPGQGDGCDGRWQWHRTRLGDEIRRQRSMRGGVGHQQGMSTIERRPITGNTYFINKCII